MKQLIAGLIGAILYTAATAQSVPPIQGWKMKENNGRYTYTPASLFGSIPIDYDVYPPQQKDKDDLAAWLENAAQHDISQLSYTTLPGKPSVQDIKSTIQL